LIDNFFSDALFSRDRLKTGSVLLSHSETLTQNSSVSKKIADSLFDLNSKIISPFFSRERSSSNENEISDFKRSLEEEKEKHNL